MKKRKTRKLIRESMVHRALLTISRKKVDRYYVNVLPLAKSKKLLLCINDEDFQFDGYKIIKMKDISKVEDKGKLYNDIFWKEGLLNYVDIPQIGIESWKSVLAYLENLGEIFIIESEAIKTEKSNFAIGMVEKVGRKIVKFRYFDAEGIWQKNALHIPYKTITSVSFGGRYESAYSKYISIPQRKATPSFELFID